MASLRSERGRFQGTEDAQQGRTAATGPVSHACGTCVARQVTGILASRGRFCARDKEPGLDWIIFPFSTGSSEAGQMLIIS